MNTPRDRLPNKTALTTMIAPGWTTNDTEGRADSLLEMALDAEGEQTALLEATPLESQYGTAFAAHVEAKYDQVDRIEDRLEILIDQQRARLQQARAKQPGLLTLPSARAKWQRHIQQQQSTMQRLQGRLEIVRELRDGMGVHGPRIEEFATRKLRSQEPELAAEFDDMREAQRRHQMMLRKREQDKGQAMDRDQRELLGRPLTLALSKAR